MPYTCRIYCRTIRVISGFGSLGWVEPKVLTQINQTYGKERNALIDQLRQTPEGQKALDEAQQVATALEKRFGPSYSWDFKQQFERLAAMSPEAAKQVERVQKVAKVSFGARSAEITRDYERKQELTQNKSLGLSM